MTINNAVGWAHEFGPDYKVGRTIDDGRKVVDPDTHMVRVEVIFYPPVPTPIDSYYPLFDTVFEAVDGFIGPHGGVTVDAYISPTIFAPLEDEDE